jgi:hypothetical protein
MVGRRELRSLVPPYLGDAVGFEPGLEAIPAVVGFGFAVGGAVVGVEGEVRFISIRLPARC